MGLVIATLITVLAVPPVATPRVPDEQNRAEVTRLVSLSTRDLGPPLTIERLPLMARKVAYCESGLRNDVSPATSTASGFFQFLDGTWRFTTGLPAPAAAYSLEIQHAAFEKLWDEGRGAAHWEPSRYCWQEDEPWKVYSR